MSIERNFSYISSNFYELSAKINELANQFNELSYNMQRINYSSEMDYNFSDYFNYLMEYINRHEIRIHDIERKVIEEHGSIY